MEDSKPKSPRAQKEEEILEFWKENSVFEKTLSKESPQGEFVFYEGPPTANGRPAVHHLEARAFKDAIPRYKTMQGFHVRRKAGWDTHGLPVELEVEKQLGLKSKKEIEAYGIDAFNEKCKESVWKYVDEWRRFSDRMGYWVDLDRAYVTYRNSFIEAVWSIVAEVEKQGLLYKDYKVVPWCPRCGTALSSHELAQGYKDVKDLSLYVKFRLVNQVVPSEVEGKDLRPIRQAHSEQAQGTQANEYLLAWTTTPWTLPGNIALAVGEDIDYVKVKKDGDVYIIAESKIDLIEGEREVLQKLKGKDLVGLSYEPLYPFVEALAVGAEKEKLSKAFKVYAADFVTTEDGTGIVHTAVMYGQEDFELGTKEGLPKVHLVSPDGSFVSNAGWLSGRSTVDEELAVDILKDLQQKGNFFAKENYAHSYPFCWRCKTRLIYYARDSWYIRMSSLRDELVKENKKIHWEPEYIQEGRFVEWLREVKDWAISRERYWGTPLPVWQNALGSKRLVVDSLETLRTYAVSSGNTYFVMRHGGTESNKHELISYKNEASDGLTEEGRQQVEDAVKSLKGESIDLIIASPFVRTRETAEIIARGIGLKPEDIVFDKRIQEINPGEYDGRAWPDYHDLMAQHPHHWFEKSIPGGESLSDASKRIAEALYDIEATYKNKKILLVTHGGPAWLMYVNSGLYRPENQDYKKADTHVFVKEFKRFSNAEARKLPFATLPHNKNYELDFHRPFVDDIVLSKDGEEYRRVKEVMDVWFDSGAVPFAQDAGDRERAGDFEHIAYPADFISEGIDQTRGWFYTMHAIGTLMGRGRAYKNVICLGHLTDKDGRKMSKSVGNVIDPWEAMDKHGVDTLRLWMYSINQPGESKNYDDRTVDEIQKRIFNLLDNVYAFYDLYRNKDIEKGEEGEFTSPDILDTWIIARSNELLETVTKNLDTYRLLEPVRAIRDFIDDLSTWYLRRSRSRIKEGDEAAKKTLYVMLKQLSKILAPLAPFYAEDLYQKLKTEADPLSVHLTSWPHFVPVNDEKKEIIKNMKRTRELASLGLEARSRANIKVRQPLSSITMKLDGAFGDILADELNVKSVIDREIEGVELDTVLTPELVLEGEMRELVRQIQDQRKEKNLSPEDKMSYVVSDEQKALFEKFGQEIITLTNIEVS
jgi:isoleucyl-tRNA synthetase